ncbi:MAG: hypothetical protein V1712_00190 [Patescibacteria group bacterium]
MKKTALLVALFAVVVSLPLAGAFEAHVINVIAHIENALLVQPEALVFGTVFPQENMDKPLTVTLSSSFLEQDRVDQVNYMIRQKPTCGSDLFDDKASPELVKASEDANGQFYCPEGYHLLPLLCPYLSKTSDGGAGDVSILPFHGPLTGWDLADTIAYQANGALIKTTDQSDIWTIDLKVPCFGSMCAQDWASYVEEFNPEANPANYIQDPANQSKFFGCDLWVEVVGIDKAQEEQVAEVCGDGIDNDGDQLIDENCPWVNEFHYDNTGADTNEGVEIAGPAGTDLTGWAIVFYNGADQNSYGTLNLSGTIPNQQASFGTLWFAWSGIQNGAPDGLALVTPDDSVIQFLSYEGRFIALDGPANNMLSVDIGVDEDPIPTEGESLQLQGTGNEYADFVWTGPIENTYDAVNTNQTFN